MGRDQGHPTLNLPLMEILQDSGEIFQIASLYLWLNSFLGNKIQGFDNVLILSTIIEQNCDALLDAELCIDVCLI